jgi:hypothetical protein
MRNSLNADQEKQNHHVSLLFLQDILFRAIKALEADET